jgi:hypothetical protein
MLRRIKMAGARMASLPNWYEKLPVYPKCSKIGNHDIENGARRIMAKRKKSHPNRPSIIYNSFDKRYKLAPRLTSNVIFGSGDGILGPSARNEAISCHQVRIDKVNVAMQKKKLELTESLKVYRKLKSEPNFGNPDFKWTVEKLKIAIKVKKLPGDKALPTSKEALLDRYNKTKRRLSPLHG